MNRTTRPRAAAVTAATALTAALTVGASPVAHAGAPELRTTLETVVTGGPAVGAVAAVESPAEEWSGAAGVQRPGDGARPAAATDAFRVGSVSKTFVATLVMKRVQDGTWRLTSTVADIAPGLLPADRDEITLQQLLSHRSGLTDYLAAMLPQTDSWRDIVRWHQQDTTESQMLAVSTAQPVLFAPGTRWSYSNTNYLVLGMLLERQSGRSLADLVRDEISTPLGLTRTSLDEDPGIEGGHLTDTMVFRDRRWSLHAADPSVFGAAGGVVSTAEELNRFYEALLTGKIVRGDLVDQMVAPRARKGEMSYGLGIYSLPDPCDVDQRVYGHDGATLGTLTLSFHSRDGRRHATVAMVGRPFDGRDPKNMTMEYAALRHTCPTAPENPAARAAFAAAGGTSELAAR